jgi:hypothetical protein
MTYGLLLCAAVVGVASCSGRVENTGSDAAASGGSPASGGSQASGGTPGASSGGTSALGGMGADPIGCPAGEYSPYTCATSCADDSNTTVSIECVNGQWTCPERMLFVSSCPANSCARAGSQCCDRTTGAITAPSCAADGTLADCPSGTRQVATNGECSPDGVTCGTNWGEACASTELQCRTGGHCGCTCSCAAQEDGGLAWVCLCLLC